MESVRFHDSKLKLLKALLFSSFHETEAPTAGFCSVFICGRAYCILGMGSEAHYRLDSKSIVERKIVKTISFLLEICDKYSVFQ